MPTDGQRFQKRTPATVSLQVSSAAQPFITDLAFVSASLKRIHFRRFGVSHLARR